MEHVKLWQNFLQGDKKALSYLFISFYDDLINYGIRLNPSKSLVEDSMQDMFLKLWKNRNSLGDVQYIKQYLFKALRRQIISNLSYGNRHQDFENISEEFFDIHFSHEDFLISKQLNKEIREQLISALNELSKRQKEAIYLRYFQGLEFETIAEVMDMNIQSVRNSIQRGLKKLKHLKLTFFLLLGLF